MYSGDTCAWALPGHNSSSVGTIEGMLCALLGVFCHSALGRVNLCPSVRPKFRSRLIPNEFARRMKKFSAARCSNFVNIECSTYSTCSRRCSVIIDAAAGLPMVLRWGTRRWRPLLLVDSTWLWIGVLVMSIVVTSCYLRWSSSPCPLRWLDPTAATNFVARFTGVEILSENLAALRGYPRTGCSSSFDSSGESAGNGILGSSREVVDRCRLKS